MPFRVSATQKVALHKEAAKRGLNATDLLRDAIYLITGVKDLLQRHERYTGRSPVSTREAT